MDYLKIGKATDLSGKEMKLYRILEILPGFFSWSTLLALIVLSYFKPVFVAYFIIAFDIYWLLLVIYLGIHLIYSYNGMKNNLKVDWPMAVNKLGAKDIKIKILNQPEKIMKSVRWNDLIHLVILPIYKEDLDIIKPSVEAIINSGYPLENIIMVLALEASAGNKAQENAVFLENSFGQKFKNFLITVHPENIPGEIKGKGSNQAWAARKFQESILKNSNIDKDKIIISVFDIDTVIYKNYFYVLTYNFLVNKYPHRSSYQPIPIYNNNIWDAPFFSRVAASSNTFWQMMQQIRQEKLATYSSHSMTWRALEEIGFWSTSMVSEDSRIFWHCFCFYAGDYTVQPLHYPVSMDVCMDENFFVTAKNLYKQQRRWGWGVENVPYLIFCTIKKWKSLPKLRMLNRIFVQLYGFHSWATNAVIIAVVGWLPLILGGDRFTSTVLSTNLPFVTRMLMIIAMSGLVLSAVLATLLLPPKPKHYKPVKYLFMLGQWFVLPFTIIFFGSIPGLEAQTRLMIGKYLGFWATPKTR